MLRETFQLRMSKPQVFQALFLSNDKTERVEVLEDERIDFTRVQEHLESGGSIFITSKSSQKLKLKLPRNVKKPSFRKNKMTTVTTYYIDHM